MTTWEYKSWLVDTRGILRRGLVDVAEVDTTLAEAGRAGWDLVTVVAISDGTVGTAKLLYTFKRAKPAAS